MLRFSSRLLLAASFAMIAIAPVFGEEKQAAITFSTELRQESSVLAPEKNGVVALLDQIKAPDPAATAGIERAQARLSSGQLPEDPELLKLLDERHQIAVSILKAPAQCPRSKELTNLSKILLSLYQGMFILSQNCALQGKEEEAHRYLEQGLEWSHLIRKGNPTLLEATIALAGWQLAFDCAFAQWETSGDQKAGLKEIERLFNTYRIPPSDYATIIRREAHYWADCGGTKGILQALAPDQTMEFMLRPPFAALTAAQILELPFDQDVEVKRYETFALAQLEHVKKGDPLAQWLIPEPIEGQPTLEDYRSRPNGLGDLCCEQLTDLSLNIISSNFFKDPAVKTCIAWLKAEGEGRKFMAGDPDIVPDPVDGKPLRIDVETRIVRSIGTNLKLDTNEKPVPGIGYSSAGDDPCFQVPSWRDQD